MIFIKFNHPTATFFQVILSYISYLIGNYNKIDRGKLTFIMTVNTRFIPKLFIKNNNSKLKAKRLKQKGLHIYAKLVQFKQCNSTNNGYKNYHKDSILGIDPEYQLIAEWFDPDSNKNIELKSRNIKANEDNLKYFFKTYRNVSIYIDPKNKDNYYFDLPVFVK